MKMKSYTDLEQSERLAKILPLESADMSYTLEFDSGKYYISTTSYKSWIVPKYAESYKGLAQVIPCWSLAALLDALPKIYELKPLIDLEGNLIMYSGLDIDVSADNLIDACIDMIIKLKESNLLKLK